jgi:hypothetical protein
MLFPLRFTGVAETTLISLVENCNSLGCDPLTQIGASGKHADPLTAKYAAAERRIPTPGVAIEPEMRMHCSKQSVLRDHGRSSYVSPIPKLRKVVEI